MTTLLEAYQPDPDGFRQLVAREAFEAALCCEMRFASKTMYMTNRNVDFVSNGKTWQGLGNIVGLSEVQSGPENLTPVMEYTLSIPWELVDDNAKGDLGQIPSLMGNESEYKRRLALLSIQLFDNGQPYGIPFSMHVGRMERPTISIQPGALIVFRLDSESILIRSRTPPAGKLTDSDQKSRHPTDRGLELVPNAVSEPVDWLNS